MHASKLKLLLYSQASDGLKYFSMPSLVIIYATKIA